MKAIMVNETDGIGYQHMTGFNRVKEKKLGGNNGRFLSELIGMLGGDPNADDFSIHFGTGGNAETAYQSIDGAEFMSVVVEGVEKNRNEDGMWLLENGNVVLNVGQIQYEVANRLIGSNYADLAAKISDYIGFPIEDVNRGLKGIRNYCKGFGKTLMGVGIIVSATQLANSISDRDINGVVKSSTDLGMAYVGTLGVVGFGISVVYFIGTETGAFDWIGDKVSKAYEQVIEKGTNWWRGFIQQLSQYQNPFHWNR